MWARLSRREQAINDLRVFMAIKCAQYRWQESHPGGDFILQEYGGKDASDMFRSVQHSKDALSIRPNFMVARLKKKTKSKL